MADVDKNSTSETDSNKEAVKGLRTEIDTVNEQLRAMNATFKESIETLANSMKPAVVQKQVSFDDAMYDADKMEERVTQKATEIAQGVAAKNRELDMTIYNLSQDYPEITSDSAIQKSVKEIEASLPAAMRGTAIGLETAVLKAVTKAGLMPKSKRQTVDEDISFGSGRSQTTKPKARAKVDQNMLDIATLMGRDITDKNVLKGLEDAANRDTFNKYR